MRSGRVYKAEFTGHVVGGYSVELSYGGVAVPGSPFVCNLYDVTKVRITESAVGGCVGQPVSFAGDFITLFIPRSHSYSLSLTLRLEWYNVS